MLSVRVRLPFRRRPAGELRFLRTSGFFCDPYSQAFREQQDGRLRDLDGAQADHIARHVGWQFSVSVPPIAVLALPVGGADCVAIGWASATSLGVNLTYAVAKSAEGQGLARCVTSLALLELDDAVGGLDRGAWVHAQYDVRNKASAAVARSLGLAAEPQLELQCRLPDGSTRHFLGARACVGEALERAASLAAGRDVWPMPQAHSGRAVVPGRRSGWAPL